jgi:undecaprenyl-diphosphatase
MEQAALFQINHCWTHPALDMVMAVASSKDFWLPFIILGLLLVLVFGGFRARMMLLAAGISIGIADGLVVNRLKEKVGRPRPHETLVGVRTLDLAKARPRFLAIGLPLKEEYSNPGIPPARGVSFPSAHAANNFVMATVVALFYRRRGWLAFLPAAIVAYSRVYVGAHWPLDVLVSCFLGTGIALLVVAALDVAWRKWGGRFFPTFHVTFSSILT